MKHFKKLILLLIPILLVTGCTKNMFKNNEVKKGDLKKINFIIDDDSLTNEQMSLSIEDKTGKGYAYKLGFTLEKKTLFGWKAIEKTSNAYIFEDTLFYPNEEGKLSMNQDWSIIYGTLTKGKYRLGKEVIKNNSSRTKYIEFKVN